MKEARFWEPFKMAVGCRLCPHGCLIKEGKLGLCKARRNKGGALYAESYGQISSLAMDPIEKKPLKHFYPGRYILSVGSYGCNLTCPFCQNSSISQKKPQTRFVAPEELVDMAKAEPDNLGIAFTYNEPFIGIEYLLDTAPLIRRAGLKTVLVTNGTVNSEPLNAILPYVDAMNIDVKGFTPEFYKKLGGDLETVKRTVKRCAEVCHIEATTLIIPGENDSLTEMEALSEWLSLISPDIPLHITRFFPCYRMTDKAPTSIPLLHELAEVAKRKLKHVHVGNC